MANCSICGKPVLIGKVCHNVCLQKQSMEKLKGEFCDQYCRFPRELHRDEHLAAYCDKCPLNSMLK